MSSHAFSSTNFTCAYCAQAVSNGSIANGRIYCSIMCQTFHIAHTTVGTNGASIQSPYHTHTHQGTSSTRCAPVPQQPRTHPLDLSPWDGTNCSVCAVALSNLKFDSKTGVTCSLACRDQGFKIHTAKCETEPVFECICTQCEKVFKSDDPMHYPTKVGYFCSPTCLHVRWTKKSLEEEEKREAERPKVNKKYETSDSFTYVVTPIVVHKPVTPPRVTFIPIQVIPQTGAFPRGFFTSSY